MMKKDPKMTLKRIADRGMANPKEVPPKTRSERFVTQMEMSQTR